MDRFWLPQYPPGVPPTSTPVQLASLKALIEECLRTVRRSRGLSSAWAPRSRYRELEQRSRAFGAWLQHRAGLKPRRSRRHHAAQSAAVPDRDVRRAARGTRGRQYQPALHGLRTASTSSRIPAPRAVLVLENFAATLRAGAARHRCAAASSSPAVGEQLKFPKGAIVNAGACGTCTRKCRSWHIQGARRLDDVIAEGRALELKPVNLDAR